MQHPDLVFAYLDPMSGSLVLQAVVAGVLGGIVTMKRTGLTVRNVVARFWRRSKGGAPIHRGSAVRSGTPAAISIAARACCSVRCRSDTALTMNI